MGFQFGRKYGHNRLLVISFLMDGRGSGTTFADDWQVCPRPHFFSLLLPSSSSSLPLPTLHLLPLPVLYFFPPSL